MKALIRTSLFVLSLSFNLIFAQAIHDVALGSMEFIPDELTITVNDTVRWTNNGGLHNVVADDNSFTSGSVSSTLWVYKHAFPTIGSFRYYCQEHGAPNGVGMAGIINVESATGLNDEIFSLDFKLKQNYPNPFNPATTVEYSIPQSGYVTLKVYNVTGSLEKVLISEFQPGGNYIIEFNASDLTSGVYFYQLIAGDYISTKRMTFLK
jgi:plastocyanin